MIKSYIQWTNSTVNFWIGCYKVSNGCKYCYMYRDMTKYGKDPSKVKRTSDATFYQALKWKDSKMIFTCSWSDFFIEEADQWRADAWEVIRRTPQHTWQILTKRPERILPCLPADWGSGYPNVWLGTTIESQEHIHRAFRLATIPAKVRFISAEPLLGDIRFNEGAIGEIIRKSFHWIIVGGESGNNIGHYKYRECQVQWIERIIKDFRNTPVKVFVKQLGTHLAKEFGYKDRHGGDITEWPTHLQVREFPDLKP